MRRSRSAGAERLHAARESICAYPRRSGGQEGDQCRLGGVVSVGLAPSVMRPLPASFSLLAVDARPTCTHHNGRHFARASPRSAASTRNVRYPRRFAATRAFHRRAHFAPMSFEPSQDAPTRDKAVQVSLYGFGQHENPICERPRHLAMAITSSNFVLALLRLCRSACTARHPRFCAASFS